MTDLTERVTGMINRINEFRKSKRQTKTRTPRKKRVVINTALNEFNNFEEDLRNVSSKSPSKSPEEVEVDLNNDKLNSPDSPREQTEDEKVKAYANQVSKMMSMINYGKLEKMTKKTRKPKATLQSRKNSSNRPTRRKKIGTSLNGTKPRKSSKNSTGNVSL